MAVLAVGLAIRPELFARQVLFAVHQDVKFGGGDACPSHTRKLQRRADVQVRDGLLEQLERNAGVEQRAEKHIAADAGKTIEIGNAHGIRRTAGENFMIGKARCSVKPRDSRFATITHSVAPQRHRANREEQKRRPKTTVYLEHQKRLADAMRAFLRKKYQIEVANVVIDQPPSIEMGEFALPLSFELAKRLRKPPRKIAEEIAAQL